MNPFEAGTRKSIPAVLIYARFQGRTLMIHRDSPGGAGLSGAASVDYHSGKWNGLGGKCEADESPLEAARREFHEEAGLLLADDSFHPLGVLTFPNFKAHRFEDWTVFVFTAELSDHEAAKALTRNAEGGLHWIPDGDLLSLNLWPGDQHFVPLVLARRPFMGTIWYQEHRVLRHWVQEIQG
jgi:8-oxo-dGTP diphosphatase